MSQIRRRLTYANVTSSLALFLVLAGGSAIAANQLAKNTVGPKQIKANAVTAAKIKNGAVTPAKLNAAAKVTLTGPQGPKGETGPAGAPGSAIAFVEVSGSNAAIQAGTAKNISSANVSKGSANGVLCFQDLPFEWQTVSAIRQSGGPSDAGTTGYFRGATSGCPAGTEITVFSFLFSGGAFTGSANNVMVVFI